MKRSIISTSLLSAAVVTFAQTMNFQVGQTTYAYPVAKVGEVSFQDNGASVLIGSKSFAIQDISSIYVDKSDVVDNTVNIIYNGDAATVKIAGNIADYVDVSVSGAHVAVTQSADVSETTCGEITYTLSGESDNGSFNMTGSYKATLELNGLALVNPTGAVLDIQNGKRIALSVKKETVNILRDGADGTQKGAIVCKGHLEFKGKGTLSITGNTAHAIYAKEYIEVKNCTINVLGAVKDGINCSQYFLLESGEVNISGSGDDGIQTDYKDSENRETEDTGTVTVAGGKLNISVSGTATKGIKAEGNIHVTNGNIDITSSGKGKWDSAKSKTKAAACLGADADVIIDGGVLSLKASGSGGKGINCDGTLTVNDGELTIATSGGIFAYVNNTEYDGYTGNTDRLDSDAKSSPKGVKADTEVIINGGDIDVTTTGNGGEGIESKGTLTVTGGNIKVRSYDDAINSSSHMYIKGGNIDVISTNNDGLDSNGNLYMQGGYVTAFGAQQPECGIDANEEQGYTVIFTDGTLLAVGGGNSTPTSSESTQAYITTSATASAGNTITLKDSNNILATFTVPSDYRSSSSSGGNRPGGMGGSTSILITCPGMTSGTKYTFTNGSSSSNVTATLKGSGSGRPW